MRPPQTAVYGLVLLQNAVFGNRLRTLADRYSVKLLALFDIFERWQSYALMCAADILSAGSHPGFGVLHASGDHRDACVYDLMEEFRAGLAESVVLGAINAGALREEMFRDGRLMRAGSELLVRRYEERCENLVTSPRAGRRVTWRRLMREQAERYAAHVEGRATYAPFVIDH